MKKVKNFHIDDDELKRYSGSEPFPVIPDGVAHIGEKAFKECPMSGIRFPYGLRSIGYSAFYGCENLKTVIFPETLLEIEDNAFAFCPSIKEIHIPQSVESIGYGAFAYCESLEKVTFEGGMEELSELFDNCPISRLDIPDGVRNLDGLCHYCRQLKSVRLPESLETIGYKAFYGSSSLAEINLPKGLNEIEDSAFFSCDALPQSVKDEILAYNPKAFDMVEDDLQSVEEEYESDGADYVSDGTSLGDMRAWAASMRDVPKDERRAENKAKGESQAEKDGNVYLPVERRSADEKADLSEIIPKTERVYLMDKTDRKKGILKAVVTPFFFFTLVWAAVDIFALVFISINVIKEKDLSMLWFFLFIAVHMAPIYIYIGITVKAIKSLSLSQAAVTEKNVWHKTGGSLAVIKLADIKSCETKTKKKKGVVVLKLDGGETYGIEELTAPSEFSDRIRALVNRGDF